MDLGIFVPVEPEDRLASEEYARMVRLAAVAEDAGYRSMWVASRHFSPDYAALPSPLVLLGAAAQATERIRLGTSVVALPFEDPIRLAEDFATLDAVSAGRFVLGVGSGDDPPAFKVAGIDFDQRQALTSLKLERLIEIVEGGVPLHPRISDPRIKLALGAQSARGAAWAASLGIGLLQGRTEPKTQVPTLSQARAAAAYRRVHPRGRVVTARNAWIGDPSDPVLERALRRHDAYLRARGRDPLPADLQAALDRMHICVGEPEQVAALLQAEISPIAPDELIVTVDPGGLSADRVERAVVLLAEAFGSRGYH